MGTAPRAGAGDESDRSADGHEGLGYPRMAYRALPEVGVLFPVGKCRVH